jgi:hypothetical protein
VYSRCLEGQGVSLKDKFGFGKGGGFLVGFLSRNPTGTHPNLILADLGALATYKRGPRGAPKAAQVAALAPKPPHLLLQ